MTTFQQFTKDFTQKDIQKILKEFKKEFEANPNNYIKDRKEFSMTGTKIYKDCFLGTDAVTFILQRYQFVDRKEATKFGNFLFEYGLFESLSHSSFKDGNGKYRFYNFQKYFKTPNTFYISNVLMKRFKRMNQEIVCIKSIQENDLDILFLGTNDGIIYMNLLKFEYQKDSSDYEIKEFDQNLSFENIKKFYYIFPNSKLKWLTNEQENKSIYQIEVDSIRSKLYVLYDEIIHVFTFKENQNFHLKYIQKIQDSYGVELFSFNQLENSLVVLFESQKSIKKILDPKKKILILKDENKVHLKPMIQDQIIKIDFIENFLFFKTSNHHVISYELKNEKLSQISNDVIIKKIDINNPNLIRVFGCIEGKLPKWKSIPTDFIYIFPWICGIVKDKIQIYDIYLEKIIESEAKGIDVKLITNNGSRLFLLSGNDSILALTPISFYDMQIKLIWMNDVNWKYIQTLFQSETKLKQKEKVIRLNDLHKQVGYSLLKQGNYKNAFEHFKECSNLNVIEIIKLFNDSLEQSLSIFDPCCYSSYEIILNYPKPFQYFLNCLKALKTSKQTSIDYIYQNNNLNLLKIEMISFLKDKKVKIYEKLKQDPDENEEEENEEKDFIITNTDLLIAQLRAIDTQLLILLSQISSYSSSFNIELEFKNLLLERNFLHPSDINQLLNLLKSIFKSMKYPSYLLFGKGNYKETLNLLQQTHETNELIELCKLIKIQEKHRLSLDNIDLIFQYCKDLFIDLPSSKILIDVFFPGNYYIPAQLVLPFLKENISQKYHGVIEIEYLYHFINYGQLEKDEKRDEFIFHYFLKSIQFLLKKLKDNNQDINENIRNRLLEIMKREQLSLIENQQLLELLKNSDLYFEQLILFERLLLHKESLNLLINLKDMNNIKKYLLKYHCFSDYIKLCFENNCIQNLDLLKEFIEEINLIEILENTKDISNIIPIILESQNYFNHSKYLTHINQEISMLNLFYHFEEKMKLTKRKYIPICKSCRSKILNGTIYVLNNLDVYHSLCYKKLK